MNQPKWFLSRGGVLVVIGCSFFAFAAFQHTTPAASLPVLSDADAQGVFTISDNVNLVLLDVGVKGQNGGYVTGLQRANFRVFEDGRLRDITQFSSVDSPVTVGLVVDNSGSMRPKKPDVIMAGLSFARQSNSQDEFFVVNFNNSVVRGLPSHVMFTDKLQELRAALFYGQPVGQTALYDAIAYSLRHLEYAHQEKRTLIVVSDGGDNASKTSFGELMKMIEASRASIYGVGLYDREDPDANPAIMRRIAAVSGGEFFQPAKLEDVLPVFDKIAKDIRNTYTIGYVPAMSDHNSVHTVRVVAEENSRRLTVHTRTAYITTPFSELFARQQKKNEPEARH
jgi:Ca-activated chloride channel family protein